ncbi:CapA family protein [Novosphingobium terrae]|uniref:CapA family protein n=1 Tax=Novosphingobium terrae TaxID=2726189 RepID=UPI00197D03F5|nr:CapA family protein [Novosphingobium terrae]
MTRLKLLLTATVAMMAAPSLAADAPPASGALTLALGGDMIGPYQPLAQADKQGFAPIAALLSQSDLAIANFEGSSFALASFNGSASAETGGGYPVIPPENAALLAGMGLHLVSKANNHATDWGYEGLTATFTTLRERRITFAGAGRTIEEAAAPAYVATPHGTVALISVASTFTPMAVAGKPVERGGRSFDRPGINALHVHQVRLVTPAQLSAMRVAAGPVAIATPEHSDELRLGDQLFRAAPQAGTIWEADPADVARLMGAIREARSKARVVVLAIHAHETAGDVDDMPPAPFEPLVLHRANEAPSPDEPQPAAFLQPLFHQAVEAGADVVLRSGPHVIGGMELYRGRPIFYGLGSLFFGFGGQRSYKAPGGQIKSFPDGWFRTIVPVLRFDAKGRRSIQIHPAAIRSSHDAADGLPERPSATESQAILAEFQRQSAVWGTKLMVNAATAEITLPD